MYREDPGASAGLGPGSLVWQRTGDWRLLFVAGRSLLLQVAHPSVAAAVSQHSDFKSDPWGRLERTLDIYLAVIFGGEHGAVASGERLRALHKDIKGVDAHGRRYHALQPAAYHWVHATLLDGLVVMLERFGRPLRGRELDRLYGEICEVGRLYGVRDRDMPPDWAGFRAYFDAFVHDELEDNEVVRDVLAEIRRPARPPWLPLPEQAWRVGSLPAARVGWLSTVGALPPVLRERLGLPWTPANERELSVYAAAARRAVPLVPAKVRLTPHAYAAKRAARRAGALPAHTASA